MNYHRVPYQVRKVFLKWIRQLGGIEANNELLPETLWLNQHYTVTLVPTENSQLETLYLRVGLLHKQYYLEFENLNEVIRYFEDGHVETLTKL